jgi:hypothetical protein
MKSAGLSGMPVRIGRYGLICVEACGQSRTLVRAQSIPVYRWSDGNVYRNTGDLVLGKSSGKENQNYQRAAS